jgi:hypothetical protein
MLARFLEGTKPFSNHLMFGPKSRDEPLKKSSEIGRKLSFSFVIAAKRHILDEEQMSFRANVNAAMVSDTSLIDTTRVLDLG